MNSAGKSDQQRGASFVVMMLVAVMLLLSLISPQTNLMLSFSISCVAILSTMQLASPSNPGFSQRHKGLRYFVLSALGIGTIASWLRILRSDPSYFAWFFYGLLPSGIVVYYFTRLIARHEEISSKPHGDNMYMD